MQIVGNNAKERRRFRVKTSMLCQTVTKRNAQGNIIPSVFYRPSP